MKTISINEEQLAELRKLRLWHYRTAKTATTRAADAKAAGRSTVEQWVAHAQFHGDAVGALNVLFEYSVFADAADADPIVPTLFEPGPAPAGMPTFDAWFAARNGGASFESRHMRGNDGVAESIQRLSIEMRAYVSEMVAGLPR
jgi:hypothetical protein